MTRSRILHELLLDFICDLCFRIAGAEQQQDGKRGRSRGVEEWQQQRDSCLAAVAPRKLEKETGTHTNTPTHIHTIADNTQRHTHTHSGKLGAGSFIDASMRDAKRVVCVSVAWLFHLQVRTSLE